MTVSPPNELLYPTFEQTWDLSYSHSLGQTASRYFEALRRKTFVGRRCGSCDRVLVPARMVCDRCHCETGDFEPVGTDGEIAMATTIYEPFKGMPTPPYAIAYVVLDGADTAVLGYVRGVELDDPRRAAAALSVGKRVATRFVDEPEGRVTDYWFELEPDT
jgi:uncharacterized OB-fold protein